MAAAAVVVLPARVTRAVAYRRDGPISSTSTSTTVRLPLAGVVGAIMDEAKNRNVKV